MSRVEVEHGSTFRSLSAVGGIVAIVMGIIVLVWPGKSLGIVAVLVGIYAVIAGAVYIGMGFVTKMKSGWWRFGVIILGALYIIAGIVLFSNLQAATSALALVVGITVGVVWVYEGVLAFATLPYSSSAGWSVFYGIVSIIAGLILLFSPLIAGFTLWILLGISLVIMGIVQIVRWFR